MLNGRYGCRALGGLQVVHELVPGERAHMLPIRRAQAFAACGLQEPKQKRFAITAIAIKKQDLLNGTRNLVYAVNVHPYEIVAVGEEFQRAQAFERAAAKSVLRLPDLEVAKSAVLNSLSCPDAQR